MAYRARKTAARKSGARKSGARKSAARKQTRARRRPAEPKAGADKRSKAQPTPATFTGTAVVEGRRKVMSLAPGLESFVAASAELTKTTEALCERVCFTIAPKTQSDKPVQAFRGRLQSADIEEFRPKPDAVVKAVERLKQLGFTVDRVGRFAISASGPARLVSEALKIELAVQARPRRSTVRATQNFTQSLLPPRPEDLFVAPVESLTVKSTVSESIDDFVFIPPPLFFAASATPPVHAWHGVNDQRIRQLLAVPAAETGQGIKVGVIDTGFFQHPYYAANNLDYKPTPTPSSPTPTDDSHGHGTAICYNVFATAPRATVMGFKQTSPPENALEEAADAGVDIISCSWGWDHEQSFPTVELTIKDIVREGKIVLFASGNGHRAWPGSMPEVISIGGVFAGPQGQLEASNYASGYTSDLYPARRVPDVSGLCGQKPAAVYIMMPCPPNSQIDRQLGGAPFPGKDETQRNDGWVGASGTSSATPQIAGVVALMVQKARAKGRVLTCNDVRNILQTSAVPVQTGNNAQGFPAVGHPNVAVGFGLVNAGAALANV